MKEELKIVKKFNIDEDASIYNAVSISVLFCMRKILNKDDDLSSIIDIVFDYLYVNKDNYKDKYEIIESTANNFIKKYFSDEIEVI